MESLQTEFLLWFMSQLSSDSLLTSKSEGSVPHAASELYFCLLCVSVCIFLFICLSVFVFRLYLFVNDCYSYG